MTYEIQRCPHCGRVLEFDRFNARFGNQGYMYCDSDPTLITWSSYDPSYSKLSNDTHPWMLDMEGRRRIEAAIIACPNGGHFRFDALPRCPHCQNELPQLATDPTYFVILGPRIDGESAGVWTRRE